MYKNIYIFKNRAPSKKVSTSEYLSIWKNFMVDRRL